MHIEVHNRFRKSQSYEILDPAAKAEFQKHISMHEAALQQKMMEQAMMGQAPEALALPAGGASEAPPQAGLTEPQL
ncbi:MAG: hypothetical protein EBS38_08745 [Actinobacteria bacterium]|nr:hypothetical protein [Actinomycetota bacterium]